MISAVTETVLTIHKNMQNMMRFIGLNTAMRRSLARQEKWFGVELGMSHF